MTEEEERRGIGARLRDGTHLGRWPLLISGLTLLLAIDLTSADPSSGPIVLAVGAVCVGAGIVLVSWGHHDPTRRDPRLRTRASDYRSRATDTPDRRGTGQDDPPLG